MNRRSVLCLLQVQVTSILCLLPKLLLTFLFSLLFACGIYLAGREFLRQPEAIRLPVALVLPENDTYAGIAFSFIERMDSIRSVCSFTRTDRETAVSLLRSGDVYAVILIPDSFVEHILNGTNSAAVLLLPRDDTLESILFCTLAEAGVSTLDTAQAGIYAVEDVMLSEGKLESLSAAEEELNSLYLSCALNRNRMFQKETVSATDFLTPADYYIGSALVLVVLLSGLGLHGYFNAEPDSLLLMMRRQGFSPFLLSLIKLVVVTSAYTLLLFPALTVIGPMPASSLCGFFVFILTVLSYLLFLGSLCKRPESYILVSTVLSIVLLFLSGAFLPPVFLPEAVRRIGELMPTALFLRLTRQLLTGSFTALSALYGISASSVFLLLAAVSRRRK